MNRVASYHKVHQPRGSAVIIAIVLVLLFSGLSVVLMNEMISRSLRVQIAEEDLLAFEAAEAGIDAAINDINQSPTVPLNIGGVQVYTNDGHPIYVHQWSYDGNPANRANWIRPGCLGTQYWMPACKAGSPLVPVPPTDPNFDPRDNLIPSGPVGSDYVSRPMWKSFPTGTFVPVIPFNSNPTGPNMAHENYITPLSLGDTAFFTYAIDWLHDGKDNNPFPGQPATIDDPSERNKYTVYATGIHLGVKKAGISEFGTVVTIEVNLNSKDYDSPIVQTGPLELFP